jgi:hypothetical protein
MIEAYDVYKAVSELAELFRGADWAKQSLAGFIPLWVG